MLPFGVTNPATVPQRSEIPEGLMNYPVLCECSVKYVCVCVPLFYTSCRRNIKCGQISRFRVMIKLYVTNSTVSKEFMDRKSYFCA